MSPAGPVASFLLFSVFSLGCSPASAPVVDAGPPPTSAVLDFTGAQGFFGAPFPSDTRRTDAGGVDVSDFPNPRGADLVARVLQLLSRDAHGFGVSSAIYFPFTAAVDASRLPTLTTSVDPSSSVVLISVDSHAPDYLKRYPIAAHFFPQPTTYGPANLLALLPLQGMPLRPGTRYAAAVRRDLNDAAGAPLGAPSALQSLLRGERPQGMGRWAYSSYTYALGALREAGVDPATLAALTVFTTGTPTEGMEAVIQAMLASAPEVARPFVQTQAFDGYCVYATTLPMPDYQSGDPPFTASGGDWRFDAAGAPVLARHEKANFLVTIPRTPMPSAGYPVVVFSRTGGGGDRPLVDRGTQATATGPAVVPGSGPASVFARAGFAGSSIDGPHGGLRNRTGGDEDFVVFNIGNPAALRDNIRQSAAELVLQAHVLESVTLDVSGCVGAVAPGAQARFDVSTMALMGHSMGATIAPLALAFGRRFRAGILSGTGGSWIENVMYKERPIRVRDLTEVLLGEGGSAEESLTEFDPALTLLQWAGEPADPPIYGRRIVRDPEDGPARSVLMMQGIVDHYILPPIANAASLSLGLDLAGSELDGVPAELGGFPGIGSLLPLVGGAPRGLPAFGNVAGGTATAVVTQHFGDAVSDGHEVVFQTEGPKHQYRCFLETLLQGVPRVPAPGKLDDPCE